jgi:Domain of unknown function (DUF1707)
VSTPRDQLRIGDAEREAAASALGEHFASGRLTHEEYDERSARVWSARTAADLRPLFADLPATGATASGPGRAAPPRVQRGDRFRFPWLPVVLLVVALSILLPGPWWLLLVGAFFFRAARHGSGWGCSPGRRAHASGRDRAERGSWS